MDDFCIIDVSLGREVMSKGKKNPKNSGKEASKTRGYIWARICRQVVRNLANNKNQE